MFGGLWFSNIALIYKGLHITRSLEGRVQFTNTRSGGLQGVPEQTPGAGAGAGGHPVVVDSVFTKTPVVIEISSAVRLQN